MDGDSHWANGRARLLAGLALPVALSGRIGWGRFETSPYAKAAQRAARAGL